VFSAEGARSVTAWGQRPRGIQIAMQTSAESAIQLAVVHDVPEVNRAFTAGISVLHETWGDAPG